MKKLVIFALSVVLVLMGLGFSTVTATAGDGESNDMLTDANQAP